MMRYGFQMQMIGATLCGQFFLDDGTGLMEELLLADSEQEEEEIAEEVEILLNLRDITLSLYYNIICLQGCNCVPFQHSWMILSFHMGNKENDQLPASQTNRH